MSSRCEDPDLDLDALDLFVTSTTEGRTRRIETHLNAIFQDGDSRGGVDLPALDANISDAYRMVNAKLGRQAAMGYWQALISVPPVIG